MRRRTVLAATMWWTACGAPRGETTVVPSDTLPRAIAVEVIDTLRAEPHPVLGKPVWISRDRHGTYAVVDRSDKDIKLYDSAGTSRGAIGGPGIEDGRFRQLIAGGALRDSTFGYDFATRRVTLFSGTGAYARAFDLAGPPQESMPASVRPVDDSLFLVVGFTPGAESRDLIRLVRRDGSVRSTLFRQRGPYAPGRANAAVVELTHAIADGRDGVIYVGVYGSDSLFAFDYDGRELAAGVITGADGSALPDYAVLIARNGGALRRADGSLVNDGALTLTNVVAVDRTHVLLQITALDFTGKADIDPTSGGLLVAATRHPKRATLRTGSHATVDHGLLGRDADGNALALRYLDDLGTRVEVARIRLVPVNHLAERE